MIMIWTQLIACSLLLQVTRISGFKIFGINFENLHVKYTKDMKDGYKRLPLSVYDIKHKDKPEYVLSGRDDLLKIDIYCQPDDPRVCPLYDTYGIIAGIQIGFIQTDLEAKAKANNVPFEYNLADFAMFKEETLFGQKIYSTQVLFLCPNKLKAGGRKVTKGPVEEGIFAKLDGYFVKIPTNECDLKGLGFSKQGCALGMGQHYYYKLTPTTSCKDFQPFFVIFELGELVGFGLSPFGSSSSKPGGTKWYDVIDEYVGKNVISAGPTCIQQWEKNYGITSLHVFFNLFPFTTVCPIKGFETKCPSA